MRTRWCILVFCLSWVTAFTQATKNLPSGNSFDSRGPVMHFLDQISVDNGLSQSEVYCILKDSRGYVWFGTQDGLNRYDGYQITHYKHNPFDSTTISHDQIMSMYEDAHGRIWIGTVNGLNRYDPVTGRFWRCNNLLKVKQRRFGLMTVNAITTDRFGTLWLATSLGLKRFIPGAKDRHEVAHYTIESEDDHRAQMVNALLIDARGTLWVGTGNGLAQLPVTKPGAASAQPQEVTIGARSLNQQYKLPDPWVKTLAQDEYGTIWAGTARGVARINPQLKQSEQYPEIDQRTGGQSISSLHVDRYAVLWIGTDQGGIVRYKIASDQHVRYIDGIQEDLFGKKGLKTGYINSIYEGPAQREDVVWIGTHDAGVQLYSRSKNTFRQWPVMTSRQQSSAASLVFAVTTDRLGKLWIGTHEGLIQIDRLTSATQRFRANPTDPHSIGSDRIQCLLEDRRGNFWVGTPEGLYRFDRQRNRFDRYLSGVEKVMTSKGIEKGDGILSLHEDRQGNLWVGGYSSLRRIDARTGQLTAYRHDPKDANSLRAYIVYAIQEDQRGMVWVGTGFGLNKIDLKTGKITHYENNPSDPNSLIGEQVMGFLRDSKGRFWVCSNKGLSQLVWDPSGKERFIHYTERSGLPNELVYGALEDERGRIWMSTNLGLSCFDPEKKQFENYDINDGLTINEFNMNAYHRAADGEMFFGGIGSLVSFRPMRMVRNRHLPRTVLTSFKKFEKPVNVDSLLAQKGAIEILPGENFFSLSFAALDYTNSHKNQYAYMLEGFHDGWIDSGTRRYVSFTNLKPGDYVLKIRGSNSDGLWNEANMLRIPITVLPPFWQTWWFLALLVAVISGTVWLVYNYRVRKKVEHLLELERVTLAENERVRKMAAQDLHDEFGNTITRISMLTEIIKSKLNGHGAEIGPLLTKISDNSNRLYQGTKDFIWAINPEHDNFLEIAIRLKDFGDDVFDRTRITFEAIGITDDLRKAVLPMGTSRHLIFLFKEAMSNTLKHSRATSAQIHFAMLNRRIEVRWKDNGIGIQGSNKSAVGNGLNNIRSRAEKIGGKVDILSVQQEGTTVMFRMDIPHIG
ncbi:two-component regulator propeller domain-containing protein [Larkinella insperata]|uniref:Two-component regulator propeller domain-containing protein n=1 Tax=Larkinella insperata TaxID=332158 RepID=A0ABW3QKP4_9BACT|nr:sensor histidine kinase [Larkinella insperata]